MEVIKRLLKICFMSLIIMGSLNVTVVFDGFNESFLKIMSVILGDFLYTFFISSPGDIKR